MGAEKCLSLELKQVSIVYLRIEEGMLYTSMCQALTFDQTHRVVFGGR